MQAGRNDPVFIPTSWRGPFWGGVAAALVSGEAVAVVLVLSGKFSEAHHPGQYHAGQYALLAVCAYAVVIAAFIPVIPMGRCPATETWVTGVASGIVAGFALLIGGEAFGVLKRVPFQWPQFAVQAFGMYCAFITVGPVFEAAWSRKPNSQAVRLPRTAWVGYGGYCVGVGLLLLSILQLHGTAKWIVFGIGATLLCAGNSGVMLGSDDAAGVDDAVEGDDAVSTTLTNQPPSPAVVRRRKTPE